MLALVATKHGTLIAGGPQLWRKVRGGEWKRTSDQELGIDPTKPKPGEGMFSGVAFPGLHVLGSHVVVVANKHEPWEQRHLLRVSDDDGESFRPLDFERPDGNLIRCSSVVDPEGGSLPGSAASCCASRPHTPDPRRRGTEARCSSARRSRQPPRRTRRGSRSTPRDECVIEWAGELRVVGDHRCAIVRCVGHSHISFRGRSDLAHDAVWLASALSILRYAERDPAELALLTRWRALRDDPVYTSGAVDLELDEMLADDKSAAAFLRLAHATRDSDPASHCHQRETSHTSALSLLSAIV